MIIRRFFPILGCAVLAAACGRGERAIRRADAETRKHWRASEYRPADRALGWSADGKLIYLHREGYGEADVEESICGGSGIYETDGRSAPRPLIAGYPWCRRGWENTPTLSGDGRTLVLTPRIDSQTGTTRVLEADLRTGRWRTLLRLTDVVPGSAVLSADGETLVASLTCMSEIDGHGEHTLPRGCTASHEGLYAISVRRHTRRRLGDAVSAVLGWSDGRNVVVDDSAGTVLVDAASGARTPAPVNGFAARSADGRSWAVVPQRARGEAGRIDVVPVGGGAGRTVFRNDRSSTYPNGFGDSLDGEPYDLLWAPDGRSIVFARSFSNETTLWQVNVDGSGLRQVTRRMGPGS